MLSLKLFEKNERVSLYEAFSTSLVAGLAETFFIAYALHLGVSVIQSGLLTTFPLLVAGFSPLIFQRLFHRFLNSTWVMVACGLQAASIALLALLGSLSLTPVVVFYVLLFLLSLYWFGHFSSQPSWNKWVAEMIPHAKSERYFNLRSRFVQLGTLTGLLLGGLLLHLKVFKIETTLLFTGLFLVAYHLKILSFYFFHRHPKSVSHYDLSWDRSLHFFKRHVGFFSVYSVFNLALYLSSPFVGGYLLVVRGLPYEQFMWVMAALFAGKIVTSLVLDHFKKDFTPHQMYFWGGLLAAPLPAFWPFCDSAWTLSLLHFVSGWGWAAWEIGMSLAIFKKINPHEKIEAVVIYNMIGLPTQVLGTILGALLLSHVYHNSYTLLFVVAGIARFILVLPLYFQKFGER